MILLLNRCYSPIVVARTARAAIAPETAAIAVATETAFAPIAPETAIAVAAEPAATVVTIAIAIGLAHHRRGTFLVLFHPNGEIADDVFADAFLPLDFGDHRGRGRRC